MEIDEEKPDTAAVSNSFPEDVKPDLLKEDGPSKITDRFMPRAGTSSLTRQRPSLLPRLWNSFVSKICTHQARFDRMYIVVQDIKSLNLHVPRPNEAEVPFTTPSSRTPHIWNPRRRTAFHSSLTVPALRLTERFKKTSGSKPSLEH